MGKKRLWGIIVLEAVAIAALVALFAFRGGAYGLRTDSGRAGSSSVPGKPPAADESGAMKPVAQIDGRTFTLGELQKELNSRYGATLLSQLLDREAIRLEAKALGINVPPEDIDQELKRMQQGYESEEQFYNSMKEQLGMTREQIREDTLYKLLLERIATHDIHITDGEVNDYIAQHPDEFRQPIELHIAQIISASKDLADKAYAELGKGSDFAVVARDRSVDDATANSGGDLGWVEQDDPFVPIPVMAAAKKLSPGSFSQPVGLGDGRFAIVKLLERREKKGADQQTIHEQVRKQLALEKATPLRDLTKQLRDKYHAQVLDPALRP